MARAKITAYVTPDIAETLARLAAIEHRSMSDIIEDAIVRRLLEASHGAHDAAIAAGLRRVTRHLAAIERSLETHFELTAQAARFALSVTPDIPEADRTSWDARGADRLDNMLSLIAARLAADRSTLAKTLVTPTPDAAPGEIEQEAAE